jgi:hypothetical protein
MKLLMCSSVALFLVCGCSSVDTRTEEKSAAFSTLSSPEKDLVASGKIERGMDTNAVYIAWGKPSEVTSQPSATGSGTDQTWFYYEDRPVLSPGWIHIPDPKGYSTVQYAPRHRSERQIKGEVRFQNDRVVDWRRP